MVQAEVSLLVLDSLERSNSSADSVHALSDFQLSKFSAANIVDDTVQLETSFLNGIENSAVLTENSQSIFDIDLGKLDGSFLELKILQDVHMLLSESSKGHEPCIKEAELLVGQSSVDATTASMATENDVLDLEVDDSKFNDGGSRDVVVLHNVGNVAMDEDVAGLKAQDSGLGATGVSTADPQYFRRLS